MKKIIVLGILFSTKLFASVPYEICSRLATDRDNNINFEAVAACMYSDADSARLALCSLISSPNQLSTYDHFVYRKCLNSKRTNDTILVCARLAGSHGKLVDYNHDILETCLPE